jgi:hypothetical protein
MKRKQLPKLTVENDFATIIQELAQAKDSYILRQLPAIHFDKAVKLHMNLIVKQLITAKQKAKQALSTVQYTWLSEIPKGSNYSYIPTAIQNEIKTSCNHFLQFSLTCVNRKFTIHICLNTKEIPKSRIERIIMWILFVNPFVIETCSKEVNIYFYDIERKKQLPKGGSMNVLDREHINTAFTTSCNVQTSIYIFRKEENFKVFLHETCHNLGLDFLSISDYLLQKEEETIRKLFHLQQTNLRYNESYCELCARMMNTMIIVLYDYYPSKQPLAGKTRRGRLRRPPIHTRKQKVNNILQLWKRHFVYEQLFSMVQCVKLLKYNNIHYREFFHDPSKGPHYKENTQGFSYFVLSSILLFHMGDSLQWMAKYAKGSLNIQKSEECLGDFIELYKKHHRDSKYLKAIEFIEPFLEKINHEEFSQSLRMTLGGGGT